MQRSIDLGDPGPSPGDILEFKSLLFDKNNQRLPGNTSPIIINTGVTFDPDDGLSGAVVQTGLSTFNSALLSYIIFAANEETRAARLLTKRIGEEEIGAPNCK